MSWQMVDNGINIVLKFTWFCCRLEEPNITIYQQPGVADNSFTDSSGVSSCESGLGKVVPS